MNIRILGRKMCPSLGASYLRAAGLAGAAVVGICAAAQAYPPNMVSYWRFEEGTGTVASDSVDGNDGTLYGPSWTGGISGAALEFNGTGNFVEVPDSDNLDFRSDITIEAWVFPYSFDINMPVVEKPGTMFHAYSMIVLSRDGYYYDYQHLGGPQPQKFGMELLLNGQFRSGMWSYTPLDVGRWYHLVATYDGSYVRLYINGTLDAEYPAAGIIEANDSPVRLGSWAGGSDAFNGVMDEVAIYGRALSAEEIADRFRAVMPPVGVDVDSASGRPGGIACVPAVLAASGNLVAAAANDIGFDDSAFAFGDCVINPRIGPGTLAAKECTHGPAGPGVERVAVLAADNVNAIPDGLLYTAEFDIDATTVEGAYPLSNLPAASDPDGRDLPATGMPGEILVTECAGDCDGDSQVTIGEVMRAVNLFLGKPLCDAGEPALSCPVADTNVDGVVSIGEVIQAVSSFLNGCA